MQVILAVLSALAPAQQGDRPGEVQPGLPHAWQLPAAPALTPEEEAATFQLPDGLRVDLVAAEPLVEAPVQAVFDEDGRLWVVEMRGYMPDVDGHGERAPIGRVSVLTDEDGDGRMDRAARFLDGLVLPRAVAPTRGGALVIAPPDLLFCRDTDGDGVADERLVVDTGLAGIASPEYGPNGLLYTLDNAFRSALHEVRYRFRGGLWIKDRTLPGGQWGIAEDDAGRILYTTNSDLLRGDLIPSHEAARNPFLDAGALVNVELARTQRVRPARPTTSVNRAYRDGWLVDGRITKADAACGTLVQRGGLLPEAYAGDALVCEPAGNLVTRLELVERGGPLALDARGVAGPGEFLASTDERFRPVNLALGPDGAVYVADLYRGLIQHKTFLTTFLRQETLARGLERPLDRGRIWRVAPAGAAPAAAPKLSELGSADLVPYLGHANAWLRSTAQRLFVEGDWDEEIVLPRLREAARAGASARLRIHALWSLEGRGTLDEETLLATLADPDPAVRLQALRAGSERVPAASDALFAACERLTRDADAAVEREAVAVLALSRTERGDRAALARALAAVSTRPLRHAALLGAAGRGGEVLARFLDAASRATPTEAQAEIARDLAACVVREGTAEGIGALLASACGERAVGLGLAGPLLDGALAGHGRSQRRLRVADEPPGLRALGERDGPLAAAARALLERLAWPGRLDMPLEEQYAVLGNAEMARFERGRGIFATVCASCHQPGGLGSPGVAPPLRESPWLLGDPTRAAAIVLGGLKGPIEVQGQTWNLEMPAWSGSDEDVASVLTYARREWGHTASAVTPEQVAWSRGVVAQRRAPMNMPDLEAWTSPPELAGGAAATPADGAAPGGGAPPLPASAPHGAAPDGAAPHDATPHDVTPHGATPHGGAPGGAAPTPRDGAPAGGQQAAIPGWRAVGDALWSVEDGAIRGRVGGGTQSFLVREGTLGDFVLEVDVKCLGTGNSGIQVRSHQRDDGCVYGYQIEIDPSPRAWSGGLYDEARRGWLQTLESNEAGRKAFHPGAWNRFRIECRGTRIRAWVNGVATCDREDDLDREGFVALQVHAGQHTDVLWRGLEIQELAR